METKKPYRSSDVASILSISKARAYRLLATGAIPSVRFGRTVRCRSEDLEKFISDNLTQNVKNLRNSEQHNRVITDSHVLPIGKTTRLVMTDLVTIIPIIHIVRWLMTKLAAETASRKNFQANHHSKGRLTHD